MTIPLIEQFIVDIDDTLTADRPGSAQIHRRHLNNNALFDVLRDLLVERGVPGDQAEKQLLAYVEETIFWDYTDIIHAVGLPFEESWQRLIAWHEDHLIVFEDGVRMVHGAHDAGIRLSISSNNPRSGCLLKLQRAGLADSEGSRFFEEIYCSNRLYGQKSGSHWWPRVLEACHSSPEHVAVIGDNPEQDMALPREAGFQHFFLVNRSQPEPCVYVDGVYCLKSLDSVLEILSAGSHGCTDA